MTEPAGPTWMSTDQWVDRLTAYRKQGRTDADIRELAAYLEERGPRQPRQRRTTPVSLERDSSVRGGGKLGMVDWSDFVAPIDEDRHLVRDGSGVPLIRLVDAGDRLAIWSPADGGGLINPKGPGLRAFGLIQTICRGEKYCAAAYRAADLRKGRPVELRRQPSNSHDKNAVALHAPGAQKCFGFVQRGYAPVVARRMDEGESLTAVCIWGPGQRRSDKTTRLLIGSVADIRAMLGAAHEGFAGGQA